MGVHSGSEGKCRRHGRAQIAIAWIAASLAALLSPLQAQPIYHSEDRFSGATVYNTERRDVDLEGGSFWTSRFVNFQFVAGKPVSNPDFPFAIAVHTQTPDWIFIERGPSLLLKLDGAEMMELTGNGSDSAREVGINASVTEAAYYALTPEKLRRIAAAKSVEFRIVGNRQTLTGTWPGSLTADAGVFSNQAPALIGVSASQSPTNSPVAIPQAVGQSKPIFGVGFTDVPAQLAGLMKLVPAQGALVVKVMPDSIASKAGIVAGDVILEFGDARIAKAAVLQAAVANARAGQRISVKIWRGTSPSTVNIQF